MTTEKLYADLFALVMAVIWLWAVFFMLPAMERNRPGFYDFLVKTVGSWIVWFTFIWTAFAMGMIVSVLTGWLGFSEDFQFALTMSAQIGFWLWLRLKINGKVWDGGII
jgi:hypothetical protein